MSLKYEPASEPLHRLYYHRPRFAVLDEATSAINPDQELVLYKKVCAMDTTVLSIAHRLDLRALHTFELAFAGKLPPFLKLTNTEPFAAWCVVTGDATPDGIRVVRSVLRAISFPPIVAFRK